MDRRERLKVVADQIEHELFWAQCRRLENKYQDSRCRGMVVKAFANLLEIAVKQDKEISWLGICILETSLVTGSYEILLSLYDQDFYFDPDPIESYWCPPGFMECFEEDMEVVIKRLHTQFPRIWRYEEVAVRCRCIDYYYAALCQLCRDLREEITETVAFKNVKKAKCFTVFFGQYRGEGEIIWHTERI